jgi:hypothetical protein
MSATHENKDLVRELELVIKKLQKQGLVSEQGGLVLKQNVLNKLDAEGIEFSNDQLSKPETHHALRLACISASHPQNTQYNYRLLFNIKKQPLSDEKEEQVKSDLEKMITRQLKLEMKKGLGRDLTDEENMELDKVASRLTNKLFDTRDQDPIEKNDNMAMLAASIDLIKQREQECNRELYGMDKVGGVFVPVQHLEGNLLGAINFGMSGLSFMGQANNPEGNDPTGTKFQTIVNFLRDGETTDFERTLMNEGVLPSAAPSPFNTSHSK